MSHSRLFLKDNFRSSLNLIVRGNVERFSKENESSISWHTRRSYNVDNVRITLDGRSNNVVCQLSIYSPLSNEWKVVSPFREYL